MSLPASPSSPISMSMETKTIGELSKALQSSRKRIRPIRVHIRKSVNEEFFATVPGGNGRSVWNTETYKRKRGVYGAIALLNQVLAFPGTIIVDETEGSKP